MSQTEEPQQVIIFFRIGKSENEFSNKSFLLNEHYLLGHNSREQHDVSVYLPLFQILIHNTFQWIYKTG